MKRFVPWLLWLGGAALLTPSPALAESECAQVEQLAKTTMLQVNQQPLMNALRSLKTAMSRDDGPCGGRSKEIYHKAIQSRSSQILQLSHTRQSDSFPTREVYICTSGIGINTINKKDEQRCNGYYADDSRCWCNYDPNTSLSLMSDRQYRVKEHPDFTVRWYWSRYRGYSFQEYVPLQVKEGALDLRPVQRYGPQVIFALVSPKAGSDVIPMKFVWRIRASSNRISTY